MRLKLSPYILIFVPLLRTFVAAELVNNQQLTDVLSDLNNIYFQQSRSSPFATANNTLCSQHFQIYLDQINVSYWAVQSEYFIWILIIISTYIIIHDYVSHYLQSKLNPCQHGFTKSKSTITNLVTYLDFLSISQLPGSSWCHLFWT
jgi:hypothetical protein